MVLELARLRAVDRPVRRVVHARRELVREQPAADVEELDREDADVVELVEQRRADGPPPRPAARSRAGARVTRRIPSRWTFSPSGQKRVSPSRPRTPTIDSSRSNGTSSSAISSSSDRLRRVDEALSLAVVPEPPRLDEAGSPVSSQRPEACGRDPERAEELLLAQPVLPVLERRGCRDGADPHRRLDGHVLELVRDDVGAVGEPVERVRVVVRADERAPRPRRAHASGDGSRKRNESPSGSPASPSIRPSWPPPMQATSVMRACVESPRALSTRRYRPGRGCRAPPVSAPRGSARRRSASAASEPARIAAASSAALTAPARPIASVPTGTPAGICTIESSESIPESVFDSTGTPSTGSVVFEAAIPGRCAAPPAPAIEHRGARAPPPTPRTRRADPACGARTRRAARTGPRARRASRRRGASSPSRSGSP